MSNSTPKPTRRSTIQSVDRAARILKILASGPRRLGVSEIADRLGLTRPTVHGLLQTLQAHGFVEQDRDSDKYQLGAGLLQLGNSYLDLNELRARALVHSERLATRADAAVRVGVMHGANVVVVHHVFRPDTTLQILEVGAELPLHASALGKAMLAFLPADSVTDLLAEPLPRLTSRTLSPRALREQLQEVRERGFENEPKILVTDIELRQRQADEHGCFALAHVRESEVGGAQAFRYRCVADEAEVRYRRCDHVVHFAAWVFAFIQRKTLKLGNDKRVARLHGLPAKGKQATAAADDACDLDEILSWRIGVAFQGSDHARHEYPRPVSEIFSFPILIPNQRRCQLVAVGIE